jgi:Na+-translocating ferredoxin:NAD+ oxidoreductase RnfC subunit
MNDFQQNVLVAAIVLTAVGYLLVRAARMLRKNKTPGCGACGSCNSAQPKTLLTIEPPKPRS